jgi:protein phosphatase
MVWLVVGLCALAAVFLVLGILSARRRAASTSSASSATAPAALAAIPTAPVPSSVSPDRMPEANDDGGTTLASDASKSTRGRTLQSSTGSTEIEVSFDASEDTALSDDDPTGPVPKILVSAVGGTDQGKKRKHNEDAFVVLPSHSLYAIADGMGGYAAGEVASQMAVDVLRHSFEREQFGGAPIPGLPRRGDELVRAIQSANHAILEQARNNEAQSGMGTTVVAARFAPNRKRVYIAHVGDSRVYRLRDGKLEQLTTDHTLGAAGVTGPSASKLSRAVGVFDDVEVDLNIDEPREGDHYVLCSDGLFKMVPDEKICEIIYGHSDIQKAVDQLILEANQRGGKDNVSVILVRVDEPDPTNFN